MKKNKGRSFIRITLRVLNILAASALIASYLSQWISPAKTGVLAFFGLGYPILLSVNILFVLVWLFTWKRFIWVSLIAIVAGYSSLLALVPLRFSTPSAPGRDKISVLTFNIHSLYGTQQSNSRQATRNKIREFLAKTGSDIVCLQEFYAISEDRERTVSEFSRSIHTPHYAYRNYREYSNQKKVNALATFSRFPILDTGHLTLPGRSYYALYCDLLIGKDTIRVYNVHLESIRFGYEDYAFYSDLTEPDQEVKTPIREGSIRLFSKLKKAFVIRAEQVDQLLAHIRSCRHPVLLAGDFNDTPASYTYNQLTRFLDDAFRQSGKGFMQNTYSGKFPSFRIDYILFSPAYHATEYKRHSVTLSDHYPVSATIVKHK